MEGIIASIITGGLALVGVIVSNISSNRKIEAELSKAQAVTDTKLEELTREVREHNSFAQRIPVMEEKLKNVDRRLEAVERRVDDGK